MRDIYIYTNDSELDIPMQGISRGVSSTPGASSSKAGGGFLTVIYAITHVSDTIHLATMLRQQASSSTDDSQKTTSSVSRGMILSPDHYMCLDFDIGSGLSHLWHSISGGVKRPLDDDDLENLERVPKKLETMKIIDIQVMSIYQSLML